VSTVLGAALEEQRKEGEWIEGIAIWVAVAIVIVVGELHRWDFFSSGSNTGHGCANSSKLREQITTQGRVQV
jgi:hypothetical protein